MANNTFLPTGFTVTSTFATLASYLDAAGINTDQSPVTSQNGYIKNNSTSISLYIGQGTSAPSSWATLAPESAILFNAGLNTSLIWIKAASSTVTADFVEGADEYAPPTINGVIGTITANEGVVPMADADGNLIASSISDDGAGTVSIASDVTATGTVTSDDATTPAFIVASGNTNTGYIDVFGKTSGKIRITTADATAQTINITAAAQTSGAGTITIPDLAGASTAPVFTGLAQTLVTKTLTAPVLNAGTVGTSLVPTTDDGAALGDTTHNFSDLFLASGAVLNYANGNVAVTHTSGILTMGTGDFRVTTAGTNAASAVTCAGTQTLTNKTVSGNIGAVLTSYLAATVTYNNVDTLANTALSVTVVDGGIYAVELVVHSTSAVKGLNLDFAGTVTPANFVGQWMGYNAAGYVDGSSARVTAIGTDFGPGSPLDGASNTYTFTGSLEVTTGGTFLLRGAQNVADASNTTILRGSTLILTRMA